ncbi:MAG: ADP-forming succinate--CoA ligase subunit beta [Spirochaetes bacterium]|nr:MAG: ADP-forming succinate--CoA ligase subunit beta [Spirochaetota bacterium]
MSMLYEFEGKNLFKEHNIPVPKSKLYNGKQSIVDFAKEIGKNEMMVKAQALAGGRGKAGLIKKVTVNTAEEHIKSILGRIHHGKPIEIVMLEEPVKIKKEYYLAAMLDTNSGQYLVLASSRGGVDIEEIAEKYPNEIYRLALPITVEPLPFMFIDLGKKLGFTAKKLTQFAQILTNMLTMAINLDLMLVEINPLIETIDGHIIAADSKVVPDGNALFRQPNLASLKSQRDQYSELEYEAAQAGISYVQLDGEIGIIACGAGLSMATCDLLKYYGSSPANFLDVGGGADQKKVSKALEILSEQPIKGIFINVFGGITRCDEVAEGIIDATKRLNIKIPMVIRLIGTNDKKGIEILEKNGFHAYGEMEPAAKKIVELVKGGN